MVAELPVRIMEEEKKNILPEQSAENIPEEIISREETAAPETGEQPLNTLNELNDNMEVHKHPHHVTHKKKWGEFLLEFLMIFFAVFCGFLAENLREHQIEKERSRQYIESFYEDLKTDTARISVNTRFDAEKIQALNDLSNCYNTVSANMKNTACLVDVIRASAVNRPFMRTDRTLKQLANAGGFRLLNKEDADSILSYESDFNNFLDFQNTVFQDAQDNVRATFNLLVDFKANAQMFKPIEGRLITTFDPGDVTAPILFSGDKGLLNKYFNDVQLYYRITYNHRKFLLDLKAKQTQLLGYFRNKYHFE